MLLSGYLKEDFHSTAYAINVYLLSGPQAMRLTRLSREAIEAGTGHRIECVFLKKPTRKTTRQKSKELHTKSSKIGGNSKSRVRTGENPPNEESRKRRRAAGSSDEELSDKEAEAEPGEFDDFIVEDDEDASSPLPGITKNSKNVEAGLRRLSPSIFISSDHEFIEDEADWTFTMLDERRPNKRIRGSVPIPNEIVILSD